MNLFDSTELAVCHDVGQEPFMLFLLGLAVGVFFTWMIARPTHKN